MGWLRHLWQQFTSPYESGEPRSYGLIILVAALGLGGGLWSFWFASMGHAEELMGILPLILWGVIWLLLLFVFPVAWGVQPGQRKKILVSIPAGLLVLLLPFAVAGLFF